MKVFRYLMITIGILMLAFAGSSFSPIFADGNDDSPETLVNIRGEKYDLTVTNVLSDGITVTPRDGGSHIRMTRLGNGEQNSDSVARLFGNGTIAYPDYKYMLFPFDDGGYALVELIESAESPTSFKYQLDIGSDRTVSPDGSGGFLVLDENGSTVVRLHAPWAVDANDVDVPTQFYLSDDGLLTLEVDHLSGKYAYPIIADPCYQFWSSGCSDKVRNATSNGMAAGFVGSTIAASVAAAITGPLAPGTATAAVVGGTLGGGVTAAVMCILSCEPD